MIKLLEHVIYPPKKIQKTFKIQCQFAQISAAVTVQFHDCGIIFYYSIDYFPKMCYNWLYDIRPSERRVKTGAMPVKKL